MISIFKNVNNGIWLQLEHKLEAYFYSKIQYGRPYEGSNEGPNELSNSDLNKNGDIIGLMIKIC